MPNCNQHLINKTRSTLLTIIALTSLACFSSLQITRAQDNTTPADQTATTADRGPLAGPHINQQSQAPGVATGFTAKGRRRAPNDRMRLRLYEKVLSQLDLSPQQQESIKSIHEKLQTETRAYFQKHQEEINQLKTILRSNQPDAKPGQSDRPKDKKVTDTKPSPEVQNARKKMREIIAAKPKADPYLLEVWNLLTPDQQTQFRTEAETIEQAARERKLGKRNQIDLPNSDKRPFIERRQEFIKQLLDKESDQLTEQDLQKLERIRRRMEEQKIRLENHQPPQPPKASDIPIDKQDDNSKP